MKPSLKNFNHLWLFLLIWILTGCTFEALVKDLTNSSNTPISVNLSSTVTGKTNASSLPVTLVFSEDISDINEADIQVTGGTLSGLSGAGKAYTFVITPSGSGIVKVIFPSQFLTISETEGDESSAESSKRKTSACILEWEIEAPIPFNYNIVLIVDTSRTMEVELSGSSESRMSYAQTALHQLVNTLSGYHGTVNVGLISFNTGATLVHGASGLGANNLQEWHDAIDSLTPNGATNYEAAFEEATSWLANQTVPTAENHYQNITYFITDGNPTVYNDDTVNFAGATDYRDVNNALITFAPLIANESQVHAIGIDTSVVYQYLSFFDNTGTITTGELDINDRTKDGGGNTVTVPMHITAPIGEPVFVDGSTPLYEHFTLPEEFEKTSSAVN